MNVAPRLLLSGLAFCVVAGCHPAPLTDAASLMSLSVGEDATVSDPGFPGGVMLRVPFSRLICQPERYNGTRVQVSGAIYLAFEGNVICVEPGSTECLWLEVTGFPDPGFRRRNGLVENTFDGELRGHFGCCPGSIVNITRILRF